MTRLITILVALTGLGVAVVSDSMTWRAIGALIAFASLAGSVWREWSFDRISGATLWLAYLLAARLRIRQSGFDEILAMAMSKDRGDEPIRLEP